MNEEMKKEDTKKNCKPSFFSSQIKRPSDLWYSHFFFLGLDSIFDIDIYGRVYERPSAAINPPHA